MIVKVLGREVKIKLTTKAELTKLVEAGEEELYGYFSPDLATIYIDAALDVETKRRVVLHELMHATLYLSGISHFLKSKQEEAICDVTENWVDLFRDPNLVKGLGGENKKNTSLSIAPCGRIPTSPGCK